ncbi:DNA-binding transcription factor yap1 [Coemansia spiralis]|nr:DNA-binding transcription factor yap1 [Coemansia spiralis]
MSAVDIAPSGPTPQKRGQSTGLSDESHDDKKPRRPGRKPITDEAPSKRTAQNRAAQRAFRERKQQHVKTLEEKVKELTEQQERTERENQKLKQHIDALRSENSSLKNGKFTYENPPVSVDSAITANLFDMGRSPGIDLASVLELPPAGAHSAGMANAATAREPSSSASPQNVPIMYPGADLVGATAGTLANGLVQRTSSGSAVPASMGHSGLLSTAPSSLTAGFSGDIVNSLQVLAASQNYSTGSLFDSLLDATPVISTAGFGPALPGLTTPGNNSGSSPSSLLNAVTPGDLFAPLDQQLQQHQQQAASGGFFGAEAFKNPGYLASFASLIRQTTDADASGPATTTPLLSDIFALSPSSQAADGSIGLTVSPRAKGSASLPAPQTQTQALAAGSNSSGTLPPYLMAYRNPDPFSVGDDGDQLEKLLLSSMYPTTGLLSDLPAGTQQPPVSDSDLASLIAMVPPSDAQLPDNTQSTITSTDKLELLGPEASRAGLCTCRNCDQTPCDPCPIHGSPEDLSGELQDMAPQMLGYVCSPTNRLADDDLNDLCSLMYKHAKCSELQRRVETVRDSLKTKADLTLAQTKQQLCKEYGLE